MPDNVIKVIHPLVQLKHQGSNSGDRRTLKSPTRGNTGEETPGAAGKTTPGCEEPSGASTVIGRSSGFSGHDKRLSFVESLLCRGRLLQSPQHH